MSTFTALFPLLAQGSLTLTLCKEADSIRVCVLPAAIGSTWVRSEAPQVGFRPMTFVASPADLDAGFADAVTTGVVEPVTSLVAQAATMRAEFDAAAKAADEANKAAIKAKQQKAAGKTATAPAKDEKKEGPAKEPELDLFAAAAAAAPTAPPQPATPPPAASEEAQATE